MSKTINALYIQRIHKVQDYIEIHVDEALSLEVLADIAGFSKYHFHRIFKAITNESLFQFVQRTKLERIARLLAVREDMSITEISYQYGYTDSTVFSRAFKQQFGVSPTAYRKKYSKNCQVGNVAKCYTHEVVYDTYESLLDELNGIVVIEKCEPIHIVYTRFTGTYAELPTAFPIMQNTLFTFAITHQLFNPTYTKVLSIYHDHHEYTDIQHLRTSFCLSVPEHYIAPETEGIGQMTITGGVYAIGYFDTDGTAESYSKAWDYMYGYWLIHSGYIPRDSFTFEVYGTGPSSYPKGVQRVAIYVPIESL